MRLFSLAFLLGVITLQIFSDLPDMKWIGIILFFSFFVSRKSVFMTAFSLGFAWTIWFAHTHDWRLPHELEGKNLFVTGYIASIPNPAKFGTTFLFKTKKGLVHLTWKTNEKLHAGEQWKLAVHVKRIHSTMNPGGFDYEAFALQENIRATGYVINKFENKLLSNHFYNFPLTRTRQFVKEKIEKNLQPTPTSPWIVALVTGERRDIKQEYWQVLRNTGTNHLMAIAGLHIGFMASFAYFIVAWCWRRSSRLTLFMPAQHAGVIAALMMALTYSALAGFSIPTQRACLMLSLFLSIVLLRRKTLAWQAWSLALLTVLLINPLTVLGESFWLSFGSVALIIYGVSGRVAPTGWWWKWGRIQWVIGIGLLPLSLWLFQQFSLVSFVANSISIPVVGFIIVPLCLLGSFTLLFSDSIGAWILFFADMILGKLWIILAWLSHLSWAAWYQVVPHTWMLIAACVGIIILLIPAGFSGRFFGIFGLLPLLLYQPSKPAFGTAWFSLLDVGQGLSAVVETQNHFLVFDAGPRFGINYDMGESVVIPFLHSRNAKRLDMLVVSHEDNDHIGGSYAILNQFPVTLIKTSVPDRFPTYSASYCLRGEKWNWDGVAFEFLYPTLENIDLDNDSSCVLKISDVTHTFLLTGDIEKFAEKFLVQADQGQLKNEILVAPHHGSKTSAQDEFLQSVSPRYVLFPVGYRNRFHFPNHSVVEKYQALGVKQYETATSGAIQFAPTLSLYRNKHHHYWNDSAVNETRNT